jgi:hypothetical protein
MLEKKPGFERLREATILNFDPARKAREFLCPVESGAYSS